MEAKVTEELEPSPTPGTLSVVDAELPTLVIWSRAVLADLEPPPAPAGKPSPLWRNRDYMLLWSGQMISTLGSGVSGIVVPLLILALTNSPAAAGIAAALGALPYVLFSLPAGALIDRWNRKRVMILCDTGRALSLASIPIAAYFGVLTVWQLYANAFIEGSLFVLFNIAEVACLPRVVPKAQLPAAAAQNEAGFGVAGLIGPSLGGALYQAVGRMVPFVLDAVSYTISVVSLFLIRTEFQGERAVTERNLRREIGEGLAWLWRQPLIRYMAFLTGGLNVVGASYGLILIVLAKQLGAGEAEIGVIFSIGSIGAIAGSVVGGAIQRRFSFGQVIVTCVCLEGLLFPLFTIAPHVIVLGAICAALFMIGPIYNVVQFSYRLALIPDVLQGRVNSSFRLIAFGGQPLGAALAGFLIEQVGVVSTVFVFTGWIGLLALLTLANGHVRQARRIEEVQTA